MPRLFNIDCATLPQQVALNRDNIQQLAEWLTNNPDIGNISVTTLAPGSQATATITRRYDEETDKAYIDVTLGIPQGATGATGATGPEGPKGDKGDPGSDLFTDFTSVKIDTSAAHVAYSDGTAHITDATLIGYKSTGNEEVECAVDIPIVAGSGVTVDANDANNAIEVSATGGGGSIPHAYEHNIYINSILFGTNIITLSCSIITNSETPMTTIGEFLTALSDAGFNDGGKLKECNGYCTSGASYNKRITAIRAAYLPEMGMAIDIPNDGEMGSSIIDVSVLGSESIIDTVVQII